ncbi:MAG: VWA-like domain-containing protein [Eubacteriales bacterium]|nr:VWA-like domain-containing protein [Eubacteriales bacterium]
MPEPDFALIGLEILSDCRNRLYMSMPYLDQALFALSPQPGDGITVSFATDGEKIYYNGMHLSDMYLRSPSNVNRLFLHTLLHCMFRHLGKKRGHDGELWDAACDAAVESVIDGLPYECLNQSSAPARQKFYGECLEEMKVLTAEGIYRKLKKDRVDGFELAKLQRLFLYDDHGLWDMDGQDSSQSADLDEKWKDIASKVQTKMETALSEEANGGEAVLEQVRISARNDVDYRAFLRRFAARKEIVRTDPDSFDYIYYIYGLRRYGNMPLIEFSETKEEKRIEDLVIAIDTSMSTSGSLVREFLSCTYSILRSTETFTDRFNIHIIQCDNEVRSDTVIQTTEQLKHYMENVSLCGGSATDFRPVFDHITGLRKKGEFGSLRGLIYFTDGMGIYPHRKPDYEVAFVLLEEPPLSFRMPAWCRKIVLDIPALDRISEIDDDWLDLNEELPEL